MVKVKTVCKLDGKQQATMTKLQDWWMYNKTNHLDCISLYVTTTSTAKQKLTFMTGEAMGFIVRVMRMGFMEGHLSLSPVWSLGACHHKIYEI